MVYYGYGCIYVIYEEDEWKRKLFFLEKNIKKETEVSWKSLCDKKIR